MSAVFLSAFDKHGRVTDTLTERAVPTSNATFILTSNVGAAQALALPEAVLRAHAALDERGGGGAVAAAAAAVGEALAAPTTAGGGANPFARDEFRRRIDEVAVFFPYTHAEREAVTAALLAREVACPFAAHAGVQLAFDAAVVAHLAGAYSARGGLQPVLNGLDALHSLLREAEGAGHVAPGDGAVFAMAAGRVTLVPVPALEREGGGPSRPAAVEAAVEVAAEVAAAGDAAGGVLVSAAPVAAAVRPAAHAPRRAAPAVAAAPAAAVDAALVAELRAEVARAKLVALAIACAAALAVVVFFLVFVLKATAVLKLAAMAAAAVAAAVAVACALFWHRLPEWLKTLLRAAATPGRVAGLLVVLAGCYFLPGRSDAAAGLGKRLDRVERTLGQVLDGVSRLEAAAALRGAHKQDDPRATRET